MAEVRTSAYNHVVQSPRIGGCTGAFFNIFDWNSKRFASTKRLPAERPDKSLRRSKSFREDHSTGIARGCSPSVKSLSNEKDRGAVSEDEASSKPPGLVARLMGLESLPDAPVSSKRHRSRSFSGSESVSHSERDNRGEKLALRDLLKQEHESLENFCSGELAIVPVPEYRNHQDMRVKKAAVQSPIKSIVPYVDSPTGSCRSIYALPYVHKGEKSPFLARLHPSPVLQPSKCHNQMISPAKSTPVIKKRASRFLEAAVKILEEISDNEHCSPKGREGMRSIAEFAASSPPSSGTDLLHCRSMSRIWNGSEDTDSIGSRSNRSLMSRGSMSFRDSQRRDRICRDIFEASLSERAQSVSPPPRRTPRSKGATPKEVKGRGILRTQEAAVREFKTDVRRASQGARKVRTEVDSMPSFAESVQYMQQTAAPVRRSLHSKASAIPSALEGNDYFTSDEESLTDQLVRLATTGAAVRRESKSLGEGGRSSFRKSPRKVESMSSSVGDIRVKGSSKEEVTIRHEQATASSPQLRSRGTPVSSHDGMRPIRLPRNRSVHQENSAAVSSSRELSTEFAKSRSASTLSHSRQFSGQMDELKLSVRVKREKQMRAAGCESPAAPAVQCHSPVPNASPLKRSRRKSRHGSPKLRESSGHSRGGERRTPPLPNLHGERRKHYNVEVKSPARISTRGSKIPDAGKRSTEQAPVQTMDDVFSDGASPASRSDVHGVEVIDVHPDIRDENLYENGDATPVQDYERVEHVQGPARDLFPTSEVADACGSLDELLILGMDDLHWDDGMAEHQRENSSRARYCEVRASGESLQSICGELDEDVCNVDDGSSPSPQKFAGECSEADILDESSTPVLMKRFLGKPLRLDVDMGETSPVSVLESIFGDEICTTSESSIAELERRRADNALEQTTEAMNLTEIVAEYERETELEVVSTPPSEPTAIDRVRQAILDISSFRSHDGASEVTQASPQTEKTFVREVLSAAQLLCSPGRSPNWYERDLAVDPSLFEKLEGGDTTSAENGDFLCESGGMWRCDRKLLFDCVNEAFSQNVRHFKDPQPWLRRPMLRTRPLRHKLVEEVQEKINGWRELSSHAIDTLIDIDMSTRVGKWTDFSEEVAEVGAEIECMVWQVMVEEFVLELAGSLH
ncbi:hypothetical protein M758_2G222800 [Ceratodon purpureus]|nr:hypothetical protein M758_2G222800 [Ceratodon purpureus]